MTRKQKLKLYRLGICPRISWDLTISKFPLLWIEKTLNPLATRYLKRWAGLARPADPARLFLPQNAGGLNLSLPSDLYQKLQVGKASLLITSRDGGVNHAVSLSNKELNSIHSPWRKKPSPPTQVPQGKRWQGRLNRQ